MEVPRYWRLQKQRYRLVGEECPHCSEKIFPPRDICPSCGGGTLDNKFLNVSFKENNKSQTITNEQRISLEVLN